MVGHLGLWGLEMSGGAVDLRNGHHCAQSEQHEEAVQHLVSLGYAPFPTGSLMCLLERSRNVHRCINDVWYISTSLDRTLTDSGGVSSWYPVLLL